MPSGLHYGNDFLWGKKGKETFNRLRKNRLADGRLIFCHIPPVRAIGMSGNPCTLCQDFLHQVHRSPQGIDRVTGSTWGLPNISKYTIFWPAIDLVLCKITSYASKDVVIEFDSKNWFWVQWLLIRTFKGFHWNIRTNTVRHDHQVPSAQLQWQSAREHTKWMQVTSERFHCSLWWGF